MYAIAFDLDTETLKKTYPNPASWNNAYADIREALKQHGFAWQQGSVYFAAADAKPAVTAVTCFVAVATLTREYSWFAPSVRDIRMLRIEELNDLSPVIQQTLQTANANGKQKANK